MDVARMWRSRSIGILVILAALGAASPGLAVTPRIAFSRGGDLFTIVPDGSGLRRITDEAAREHSPAWSPDRQRIAFISWDRAIVVVDADGEGRRTLFRVPSRYDSVDSLAWSPDGRRIAFSTTRTSGPRLETRDCGQIWWMWADGRNPHRIVWHEPHITGISWSPSGRRLAVGFEHQNMTVACGDDRPLGIAVVRSDGTRLHALGPTSATDPDWSPDGRWIAYRDWRRTCHICGELWVIRPDGSRNRVLVPVPAAEGGLRSPRYSPAGRRITALGRGIELFRTADGGRLGTVVRGDVNSLDW